MWNYVNSLLAASLKNNYITLVKDRDESKTNAEIYYKEWRLLQDPEFFVKLRRENIKKAIENEKLKLNAILKASFQDYKRLRKNLDIQIETIKTNDNITNSLKINMYDNENNLKNIISDISYNKNILNKKKNMLTEHERRKSLSLIITSVILILILVTIIMRLDFDSLKGSS